MKDYYQILGVNKDATQLEIKKAYRQLSKQFHPDVNPEGEDKFKEIVEAYETLSDENKRKRYDNPNPNSFGGGGNPFDMFNEMMNQKRRRSQPKVKDKVLKVTLTPEESYRGVEKEVTYKSKHSCQMCNGTGGDKNTCTTCSGHGVIQQKVGTGFFTQIVESQCPTCRGRGSIVVNPCYNCNGEGSLDRFNTIRINIPKSVDSGDFLRVSGKGDFINGMQGDLLIQINMTKDKYEKLGNDLVLKFELSPVDILLNKTITINHPDGSLKINLPDNINTDKPLRLKSKGFVTSTGIGDFYVKINVVNKELTKEDKDKLKLLLE